MKRSKRLLRIHDELTGVSDALRVAQLAVEGSNGADPEDHAAVALFLIDTRRRLDAAQGDVGAVLDSYRAGPIPYTLKETA